MRVAHLVSRVGTYGGERFVAALQRAQREMGVDAVVLTGCSRNRILALARSLHALRPDIVHTHLAHAKHWGRLAALFAGVPHIVHTEHGNDFRTPLALRVLTRLLHARTDRVVAFTPAHAQRIAAHERVPLAKIPIIPNGIALEELSPCSPKAARAALGIAPDATVILSVGRLDEVKRYDRAIEAVALLPRESGAHFYVAGDGQLRDRIAAHAAARGLSGRVHLLGYRNDVGMLLAAADVVLNVSDSEAMPLSLIEALCSGVPVVSVGWPGAREFLGTHATVTADMRPGSIAEALEAALRAPAAQPRSLEALRKRFSIARAAAAYAALYEEVLAREPARRAAPTPNSAALGDLPQ